MRSLALKILSFLFGAKLKGFGIVISAVIAILSAYYVYYDLVEAPLNKATTELTLCHKTQGTMNDLILDMKSDCATKISNLDAVIKKLKDDLNTTYNDGKKQGEADAILYKCVDFDLWTT